MTREPIATGAGLYRGGQQAEPEGDEGQGSARRVCDLYHIQR